MTQDIIQRVYLILALINLLMCVSLSSLFQLNDEGRSAIYHNKYNLNIALHAQVDPTDMIVGSVITTEGLKAAFDKRYEVGHVEIFYPFFYSHLYDRKWDIVIIGGWFSMINDFISTSRLNNPKAIVLFYCLDPAYPGMDVVRTLDVDGFLTNSHTIDLYLKNNTSVPSQFLLLAADPLVMKPNDNIKRDWASVYIGAGGTHMLQYKPNLLSSLLSVQSLGLRLHGSHWDDVSSLANSYQGVLERDKIADAYASSHVVIASTTKDQMDSGMVNNRIFEALACGSIIVAERYDALELLVDQHVAMYRSIDEVRSRVVSHIYNPSKTAEQREMNRKFVINRHTWDHRCIEILDFYWHIVQQKQVSLSYDSSASSNHKPAMAWIVSSHLQHHSDYVYLLDPIRVLMSASYLISYYSEVEWRMKIDGDSETSFVSTLDAIFIVATPYDHLDLMIRALPTGKGPKSTIRKVIMYTIGYNAMLIESYKNANNLRDSVTYLLDYDLIFFRDYYELQLLKSHGVVVSEARLQHAFGLTSIDAPVGVDEEVIAANNDYQHIFLCFIEYMHLCKEVTMKAMVGQDSDSDSTLLVLMGGESISDWIVDKYHNDVFQYDQISQVMHVQRGRIGIVTNIIMSTAGTIYLMHDHYSSAEELITNTVDSIIWPAVVASISSSINNRRIHLYSNNIHLLAVINSNCQYWNYKYLVGSIHSGLLRVVALGSHATGLTASTLLNDPSQSVVYSINLILHIHNFLIGVDGKLCISYLGQVVKCFLQHTNANAINLTFNKQTTSSILDAVDVSTIYDAVKDDLAGVEVDNVIDTLNEDATVVDKYSNDEDGIGIDTSTNTNIKVKVMIDISLRGSTVGGVITSSQCEFYLQKDYHDQVYIHTDNLICINQMQYDWSQYTVPHSIASNAVIYV